MTQANAVLRVLVVDDDRDFRDGLRRLLELEDWIEVVSMAGDVDEAVSMACRVSPDVVLTDYHLPGGTGAEVAQQLGQLLPDTAIIMMSVETGADVLRPAMLSGAMDFLAKPVDAAELYAALRRVPVRPADGGQPEMTGPPPEGAEIIVVHSPKGGCGVTTLAVNLAVAKRLEAQARVALVDLSLAYGDVGLMMDLAGSTNIYDLSQRTAELDPALIADVMVTHPSGVKVLLAPSQPQQAEAISGAQFRQILTGMAAVFDYIVVDTSHDLSENVLIALDMARSVLLVSTQDVPAVRDVKLFLDVARLLEYPDEKLRLVLNRVNSHAVLTPSGITKRLGLELLGAVPEEPRPFSDASNRGVPVVIGNRGGAGSREIKRIASLIRARQVVAEPDGAPNAGHHQQPRRRGLFARA